MSAVEQISIFMLVATGIAFVALTYWWVPRQKDQLVRHSLVCLSSAVEMRFAMYHGSTQEVVRVAQLLGQELGLSARRMRNLEQAAWAQDIGLCSVPYSLLNGKPLARWTDADHAVYRRHGEVGSAMLELIPTLSHLAPIVRHHHPDAASEASPKALPGLSKESKILCLVNSYLWHAHELGVVIAKDHIQTEAGRLYDAKMVNVLLQLMTASDGSHGTQD